MNNRPKYCEECGAALTSSAKFCPQCGKVVFPSGAYHAGVQVCPDPPAAPPAPSPAAAHEEPPPTVISKASKIAGMPGAVPQPLQHGGPAPAPPAVAAPHPHSGGMPWGLLLLFGLLLMLVGSAIGIVMGLRLVTPREAKDYDESAAAPGNGGTPAGGSKAPGAKASGITPTGGGSEEGAKDARDAETVGVGYRKDPGHGPTGSGPASPTSETGERREAQPPTGSDDGASERVGKSAEDAGGKTAEKPRPGKSPAKDRPVQPATPIASEFEAKMNEGREAFAANDFGRAAAAFDGALVAKPYDPEALYMAGRTAFAAKRYLEAEKFYREAAERNHAPAQNALGKMLVVGYRPVLSNKEEARKWFRKAADQNDPEGLFNMGQVYELGWGIPEDWDEALKWYRKAAELGYAPATGKSAELSEKMRKKAAKTPTAPRQASGGFEEGQTAATSAGGASGGTPQHPSTVQPPPVAGAAEQIYEQHMKAGKDAMVAGKQDAAEASFRAALEAKPNDTEASYLLGKLCFDAKRYREAERHYRAAAEGGHAAAQNALGRMLAIGYGPVLSQKEEARKWFRKAAAQNDPEGLFNMGQVYELGWGIPEDLDEAITWYRKAADLGYGPAAERIADIQRRRKKK